MPKTKDRSQERVMIMYPSLSEMFSARRTKMKGNIPDMKVITKLMARAARALSLPFATDTKTLRSMKSELTSRASPTFLDMTFTFIACSPY